MTSILFSSVNHRELIDRGLTRDNGDDLQVYYHDNGQRPVQVDRVISGLGTKSATVQFRLQAPISANTVDDSSYSLVFGAAVSGSAMDNSDKVFAFYDDFSSSTLKKEWVKTWGKWSVQNGRLLGNTMQTRNLGKGHLEVGLYIGSGFHWKDVEVELDLMETSGNKYTATGPFLRLSNVSPSKTTGWWLQYYRGRPNECYLRPQANNRDGGWKYKGKLPNSLYIQQVVSLQISSAGRQILAVGKRQTCTRQPESGQGVENNCRHFRTGMSSVSAQLQNTL